MTSFSLPDALPLDSVTPVIYGCGGHQLSAEERDFFKAARPFGFILFHRNCAERDQLRALVAALRECAGWNCPVLIDQEGGRVARMKPPVWPSIPAAQSFGDVTRRDFETGLQAVALQARILAAMLRDCGIDVNCMPVCDVLQPGQTSEAIGDRSYSSDPEIAALLVKAFIRESAAFGMTCVLKHLPGHGRAVVDSHHDLPIVDESLKTLEHSDFIPFEEGMSLQEAAGCWGMVAHMMFPALDPDRPSSLSRPIIEGVVRQKLGFADALLVSDDLSMGALGAYGDDAARAVLCLEAGTDIALHCNGKLGQMRAVQAALPPMMPQTRARIASWLAARKRFVQNRPQEDVRELVVALNRLLPKATRKAGL